jgi:hypothetical protein
MGSRRSARERDVRFLDHPGRIERGQVVAEARREWARYESLPFSAGANFGTLPSVDRPEKRGAWRPYDESIVLDFGAAATKGNLVGRALDCRRNRAARRWKHRHRFERDPLAILERDRRRREGRERADHARGIFSLGNEAQALGSGDRGAGP